MRLLNDPTTKSNRLRRFCVVFASFSVASRQHVLDPTRVNAGHPGGDRERRPATASGMHRGRVEQHSDHACRVG